MDAVCHGDAKAVLLFSKWRPFGYTGTKWDISKEERPTNRESPDVEWILLNVLLNHADLQAVGLTAISAVAARFHTPNNIFIGRVIRDITDFGFLPQYPLYESVAELDEHTAKIFELLRKQYASFAFAPLEYRPFSVEYHQHAPAAQYLPTGSGMFFSAAQEKRIALEHEMRNLITTIHREHHAV
jgi:hypothetical protein